MNTRSKQGFTLMEMLVVIIIVMILSGILFKVVALVGTKTGVARATYELEQIRNALNDFYAEYAYYPPTLFDITEQMSQSQRNNYAHTNMMYEYEDAMYQTPWFRNVFLPQHNDPENDPDNFFADTARPHDQFASPGQPGWELGYWYGLCSYLYKRQRFGGADAWRQTHWYDMDTERDDAVKGQWQHFIADIGPDSWNLGPGVVGGHVRRDSPPGLGTQAPYYNARVSLFHPWPDSDSVSYRYVCLPPYQRYRLWSPGPDNIDFTADDIHASAE